MKEHGLDNDLLDRLAADPAIGMDREALEAVLDVKKFVGRAPAQVVDFSASEVAPALARHKSLLGGVSDVRV